MMRHVLGFGMVSMLTVVAAACGQQKAPEGEGERVGETAQALDAQCGRRGCNSASINLDIVRPDPASTPAEVFDTQLDQANPDAPGSAGATSIGTGSFGGAQRYSLIQFDLGQLPSGAALAALNASGVNVVAADLVLSLSDVPASDGTVDVHQVTSAWSQGTATWNNAPTWNATAAQSFDVPAGAVAGTTLPSIDVTTLAQAWTTGTPNYGVLLEEPGADASFYDSASSDLYLRPELALIYTLKCNSGYQDCNDDGADGCEANLGSDVHNCGACGTACPAPANGSATCSGGACGIACNPGFADCGGTCQNVESDVNNCGGCGHVCAAGDTCQNGTCVAPFCGNPGGTYAETCFGCSQSGDILTCSCCLTRNQQCRFTQFNVCTCGFNISNCDGFLECNQC